MAMVQGYPCPPDRPAFRRTERTDAYDVLFVDPTAHDAALAEALQRSGQVYLPVIATAPSPDGAAFHRTDPVPPLAAFAAGTGHVMLTPDQDGTIRHLPRWLTGNNLTLGHLTLPLARALLRQQAFPAPVDPPRDGLHAIQQVHLRYPPVGQGYRVISFIDVFNGEVPVAFIRDRVILVGATASGMGDRYASTTAMQGELTPGVEIQAAFLQTLVQGTTITPVPAWVKAVLSVTALLLLLAGFLGLRPTANTVLGLALIVTMLTASAVAFAAGIWWSPVPALAGVLIAWPLWSWRRLAAAYGYMQTELGNLRTDADTRPLAILSADPVLMSGDEVSRQVRMLSAALKQLRDSNHFITQSIQSLPDAAVVIDTRGNILVTNERARCLFGPEILEKDHISVLFVALGQGDWQAAIDAASEPHPDILTHDGRSLQLAAAPLRNADNLAAGYIVRFADMTQIRASERQRERTLQLLGHDMRAPQVSILTLLDSPDWSTDMKERIRANARQTLDLAESYVQLSRAESQNLSLAPSDMGLLLTEAADLIWPQAASRSVTLHSPDPEQEYPLMADASLMRRAFINLLDNAIRHTPGGGRVLCMLDVDGTEIRLMIADEGQGFDAEARERMFRPFQGGQIAGSGLGLAFVQTVIQRHGGQITLLETDDTGAPTCGAVFVLSLPLCEQAAADA